MTSSNSISMNANKGECSLKNMNVQKKLRTSCMIKKMMAAFAAFAVNQDAVHYGGGHSLCSCNRL